MIGIFDSGSGGLTVLQALRKRLPRADIVYFGDTANAPYGSKSPEELSRLTAAGMRFLVDRHATELISACNTASASVLAGLVGHDRVIEMTRPTARYARRFAGKRMLLIATEATVRSRIYDDALEMIVGLQTLPIPALAGAIEDGKSDEAIASIVHDAFASASEDGPYDLLLLGCTHYPLSREVILREAQALWPDISMVDPAEAVSEEAVKRFSHRGAGKTHIVISRDAEAFRARVNTLFSRTGVTIEAL